MLPHELGGWGSDVREGQAEGGDAFILVSISYQTVFL